MFNPLILAISYIGLGIIFDIAVFEPDEPFSISTVIYVCAWPLIIVLGVLYALFSDYTKEE